MDGYSDSESIDSKSPTTIKGDWGGESKGAVEAVLFGVVGVISFERLVVVESLNKLLFAVSTKHSVDGAGAGGKVAEAALLVEAAAAAAALPVAVAQAKDANPDVEGPSSSVTSGSL